MNRADLLKEATLSALGYRAAGYSLTVRQLYYALVSEAKISNSQSSYKRLVDTISEARLNGRFDMDLLVDRGRNVGLSAQSACKISVHAAEKEAIKLIRAVPGWAVMMDRWYGQPIHVSVWVEKDALSGVFERPCDELGVGLFACKGYPSHSSLWEWMKGVSAAHAESLESAWDDQGRTCALPTEIRKAVVLYFGDHDPDGWQIPRTAERTIRTFAMVNGMRLPEIEFKRVGLNMDQIREFNPPPFPAKPSSSRFKSYLDEHDTRDAWELDALKPETLDRIIRKEINKLWNPSIHRAWARLVSENRAELRAVMGEPGWVESVMGGEG